MIRTRHSFRSTCTLLVSAVFSACVVFLLFGARLTDAGPAVARAHGAVSADVSVDGGLVKEGHGWAIRFRAVNAGARIERCRVAASVMRSVDNPMARVRQAPQEIWSTSVTVTVPANSGSDEKLQIPTEVAKQITDQTPARTVPTMARTESYGVHFATQCAKTPDHVS
jgi:hypothetical protein